MDFYEKQQKVGRGRNSSLDFTTATDDTTLITASNAACTIFIQRLSVYIKTDAAQSISFEDSNGTAKVIAKVPASPGAASKFTWDFGPVGVPLTKGKNLVANFSATGLAGHVEWNGYQIPKMLS